MSGLTQRLTCLVGAILLLGTGPLFAVELHSASVDRSGERIVVRGADFVGGTTFTLGGVAIPTANVTPTTLDLPFGSGIYSAVQWRGNYALVADGTERLSLYINAAILEPPPPPPPPPPPSGGPDCPCIAGWDATGVSNQSDIVWCTDGEDGTQNYTTGSGSSWFFGLGWDPNNPYFDPVDPGNSISFCVAHDGISYTVAEAITNEDQYWDCYEHLWVNICF